MDQREMKYIVEEVLRRVEHDSKKESTGLVTSHRITLSLAKKLIEKVERKAEELGVPVIIAVVDDRARPVAVSCMDDAFIASYDIALNKAYTSAGLKMSTREVGELSQPGAPLYGVQETNGGKIVIFGGGEPLILNGKMVGALGISGGSLEQDTMLAEYGKNILEEVVLWP
ncbi:MAG TPA: heme-binding protein [Candidatus Merdenecus merdavium]|nr:heme-binding protein [Candidatus Merdenecus merdavium]